jgi:hypothetical protein
MVTNGTKLVWASLNIENLFTGTSSDEIEPIKVQMMESPTLGGENIDYDGMKDSKIESKAKFIDVMSNCVPSLLPEDIWAIHDISNEGYRRKETHIVVESETKIHVYKFQQFKNEEG